MMSGMKNMHTVSIYLKACLSAPFSVCIALRICETANTRVPLAISDGWNRMPITVTHRCAPLVICPTMYTLMSATNDRPSMSGRTILKYLHFILSVTTMKKMPISRMLMCFRTGAT